MRKMKNEDVESKDSIVHKRTGMSGGENVTYEEKNVLAQFNHEIRGVVDDDGSNSVMASGMNAAWKQATAEARHGTMLLQSSSHGKGTKGEPSSVTIDNSETLNTTSVPASSFQSSGNINHEGTQRKRARNSVFLMQSVDLEKVNVVNDIIASIQNAGMLTARDLLLAAESQYGCSQETLAHIVRLLVAVKVLKENPLTGDTIRGDRPFLFLNGKALKKSIDISRIKEQLDQLNARAESGRARVDALKVLIGKHKEQKKKMVTSATSENIDNGKQKTKYLGLSRTVIEKAIAASVNASDATVPTAYETLLSRLS